MQCTAALSIKVPFVPLIVNLYKTLETRCIAMLRPYEGCWMALHVSRADKKNKDMGSETVQDIARLRGLSERALQLSDDVHRGDVVALMFLGTTKSIAGFHDAEYIHEYRQTTFVAPEKLKKYHFVTEIQKIAKLLRPVRPVRGYVWVFPVQIPDSHIPGLVNRADLCRYHEKHLARKGAH